MDEHLLEAARALDAGDLAELGLANSEEIENRLGELIVAAERGDDVEGDLRALLESDEELKRYCDTIADW